ncbi:olfactory receptor 13D1-like [Ambystoma mexicanum]|uniref:olfactory receptor 13D1-like n=1 Tax=Ambystoma mexicanum TaxID=8296 RepID=UPI0037E97C14
MRNLTSRSEFILTGLSSLPQLQIPLFVMFLNMYLVTWVGNVCILSAIGADVRLNTPMYFFLGNLSFLDICYTTVTVPQMLVHFLEARKTISFNGCFLQMFFFTFFGSTECALLAVMAYDRYVAICLPLRYATIMGKGACTGLAFGSWASACTHSLVQTSLASRLSYCSSRQVEHFFCEVQPLLKISCSDTWINSLLLTLAAWAFGIGSMLFTLVSYVFIITAILRIPSAEGRRKTFSTCASHITVVILFYGTAIFMYLKPSSSNSQTQDSLISAIYSVLIPMLNPIIYSLRNQDVKGALRKAMRMNVHAPL